jgi:hypothetical protein
MPALVATRFNPGMKATYKQLINAGKPAKVALTAVMRKLILLANLSSRPIALGRQKSLDQYGYSRCLSQTACASVVTTPAGRRLAAGWFTLRDGPSKIYQQIT